MKKRISMCLAWVPVIVILLLSVCLFRKLTPTITIAKLDFILNALISCAATFSGFTLTIVSIMVGFLSSSIMQFIIKHGGFKELSLRYIGSILLGMGLIIYCIVVGGSTTDSNQLSRGIVSVGAFVSLMYFYSLLSSGWYMLRIIAQVADPQIQQGDRKPHVPKGKNRID